MKWFPNVHEAYEDMRRESAYPASHVETFPEKDKKSGSNRLSSTFTDSRPWNFISSSQGPERSSGSSRKRRSIFGNRNSITPSEICTVDTWSTGPRSHRDSSVLQQASQDDARPPSAYDPYASRTSLSGLENWRSSVFSRKRAGGSRSGDDTAMDFRPRHGNGASIGRPSIDLRSRRAESEDAFYRRLKTSHISRPFNFQHITHAQKNCRAEPDLEADGESMSEPSSTSSSQCPHREVMPTASVERAAREWNASVQDAQVVANSNPFEFKRGPLAGLSVSPIDQQDSAPSTPSDVDSITPVGDVRRSLSQDGKHRNLTLHGLSSAERLATIGMEQREPPAMLHPAFRALSVTGPAHEPPAMSLDSVPEETEACNTTPPRPILGGRHGAQSPCVSPRTSLHVSPSHSASARQATFTPFPNGNAFAQAHGGIGAELAANSDSDPISFSCVDSVPSLISGESWENDVDLLYLVEAESTCDFDWTSLKSSRKDSDDSPNRQDSMATSSTRTTSVHDDASSRPSSARNSSKSYPDDALFAGFDGISPFGTLLSSQKSGAISSVSKRHSAINATNGELSPIPESSREVVVSSRKSSSETIIEPRGKHGRSASHSDQRPPAPKRPSRWSIASPLCLPEDVKCRRASFTDHLSPVGKPTLFSAPLCPPPALPLPDLPKPAPSGLVSPPLSPPTLCAPEFTTVRRPSSPQDRALLQAAGRIVQRGRSARPSTPSRLSHVHNAMDKTDRKMMLGPLTPPKMEAVQFKISLFPTPPSSPPRQEQHEEYPAWI